LGRLGLGRLALVGRPATLADQCRVGLHLAVVLLLAVLQRLALVGRRLAVLGRLGWLALVGWQAALADQRNDRFHLALVEWTELGRLG
jgi:hypothetical protein